jgi:hypothetical protein
MAMAVDHITGNSEKQYPPTSRIEIAQSQLTALRSGMHFKVTVMRTARSMPSYRAARTIAIGAAHTGSIRQRAQIGHAG